MTKIMFIIFTTNYVPVSNPSTYLNYTSTITLLRFKIRHLFYI